MRITPPGDDVVPVPPRLDESPPYDRFCDLVTTGGVASGVVYPWAIVEIARAYRFRSIGGTSVGAMAAALAAAAEYGRRTGNDDAFEPLRRLPGALGEPVGDGRTRMLSLFQTNPQGRRLMELWRWLGRGRLLDDEENDPTSERRAVRRAAGAMGRVVMSVMRAYAEPLAWIALAATAIGGVLWWRIRLDGGGSPWLLTMLLFVVCLAGALVAFAWVLWCDVKKGVIDNNLGLCKGGTTEAPGPEGKRPGISEWLHDGIQASAGMKARNPPLTFRDLWCAPAHPGAEGLPCGEHDPPDRRSINLQMITTNVTHGRPYRLPLFDETSRLFYRAEDLKDYFPQPIIDAMVKVSRPYRAISSSDAEAGDDTKDFLELPGADMPIVVAARLSLSYPLLFSAVPLWAIDYEPEEGKRELKRCLFTDGGVSSNFPIHLFDAAMPRWPTFGMWLDRRDPNGPRPKKEPRPEKEQQPPGSERDAPEISEASAPEEEIGGRYDDVWLPDPIAHGWGDSWNRFDPFAADASSDIRPEMPVGLLANLKFSTGFLAGIVACAIEWRDRTSFRLPHVRNRVARLRLREGEGGLNIGMPREQILRMAHRYGTKTGRYFVERFADSEGQASQSWREQRWIRMVLLVRSLRERLTNLRESFEWTAAFTLPMDEAIELAQHSEPLRDGARSRKLEPWQAGGMRKLLAEIQQLERSLRDLRPEAYKPVPEPEMRLRPPL
ncbi:MAG: patatin-like phospholipase family protein [Pseudomonadota bacterium]|nr:patatin-like phospholipase family protein [Burkholderiaceae bacterium]MDQ3447392.1 patatin-like phospholipase family protein [Pseudomonadota bacterium]